VETTDKNDKFQPCQHQKSEKPSSHGSGKWVKANLRMRGESMSPCLIVTYEGKIGNSDQENDDRHTGHLDLGKSHNQMIALVEWPLACAKHINALKAGLFVAKPAVSFFTVADELEIDQAGVLVNGVDEAVIPSQPHRVTIRPAFELLTPERIGESLSDHCKGLLLHLAG
jgi:hypothetical protein